MVDKKKALAVRTLLRKQKGDDIKLLADVMNLKLEHYNSKEKRIHGIMVAMGISYAIPQREWQKMENRIWTSIMGRRKR